MTLALCAGLGLTGCRPRLEVGVVLPESGEAAAYGASIKSGITLAFEDLKAAWPALQNLEVAYRDSGSDPARAASAAEAMFERDAVLVIGGVTSAEAKAMIPVADQWKRILLSPSASAPRLTRVSTYFFRVFPSDELEGVAAADYLIGVKRVQTVVVVSEASEYTRGLLPVFVGELQGRGGQIVDNVVPRDASWEADLRGAIAKAHPDAVYLCGYDEFILRALRLLRSIGFGGFLCTTSAAQTASLLQRAGKEAEGVVFPLAGFDLGSGKELTERFVERYRRVYSLQPDIYAGHGYDAALAAGLALVGLDGGKQGDLRASLRALGGRTGVMGPLAFDDYGNVKHTLGLYQIHGGRVEALLLPPRGVTP
jgi:branched-chain amino acid transport system substrate-binding protein